MEQGNSGMILGLVAYWEALGVNYGPWLLDSQLMSLVSLSLNF